MPGHPSVPLLTPYRLLALLLQVVALLRANPAVAIPTVLARLMQKDQEWHKVLGRGGGGGGGGELVRVARC